MLDAVYQAYFVDGRDIGKKATLIEIGRGSAGGHNKLDNEEFLDESPAGPRRPAPRASAASLLHHQGQKFGVSGAQPPSVLLEAMEQASRHV